MGKPKHKSFDSSKLESKLDQLINTIEKNENKASARHKDLTKRLDNIEVDVEKCKKQDRVMSDEIIKLKASINSLEQSKLENYINIRGVPELEEDPIDLRTAILGLFQSVSATFTEQHLMKIQRIGKTRDGHTRPIVVQFSLKHAKDVVLESAKTAPLDRSLIKGRSGVWGTSEHKIYLGHHLTHLNSTIFFEARKLRKKGIVKYAWVKDGQILIKKSNSLKAVYLNCPEDIKNFLGKRRKSQIFSSTKEDHSKSETSSEESSDESNQDTEASEVAEDLEPETVEKSAKTRSQSKRQATSPPATEQPLVQRARRNQKQ